MFEFLKQYSLNCRGTAAVEFALVAVPFLMVIFGVMEVGRVMWVMNGVEYVIEETGRYASLNSDLPNADLQAYAQSQMTLVALSAGELDVTSGIDTSNGVDFVELNGRYSVSTILSSFFPEGMGTFSFDATVRKPVIN